MGISKFLVRTLQRHYGVKKVFYRAAQARRDELTAELSRLFGDRVQSGPFAGMLLPASSSWGDGCRGPKLLGTYEANLHPAVQRAVERRPATIINVGCAEGFYAIGLARLLPDAAVFALDIDPRAQEVCRAASVANGVGDRVAVGGACTSEGLAEILARPGPGLIVSDCEGAERDIFDPMLVADFRRCDLIIEAHDFIAPGTTELLARRFRDTHSVELIGPGGRNPFAVPELAKWNEKDCWVMVEEARPGGMTWLACWAK